MGPRDEKLRLTKQGVQTVEIQVVTKQEKHLLIPQKMDWNGRRLEAGIAVQRLSPYFQFENLVAVAIK